MTEFPKSSVKYLGKSEDTRAQDPRQQMRNEKLVWLLSFSADSMARKIQIFEIVILTRPNGEIRKVESRALNQGPIYYIGPIQGHLGTHGSRAGTRALSWDPGPRPGPLGFVVGPGTRAGTPELRRGT